MKSFTTVIATLLLTSAASAQTAVPAWVEVEDDNLQVAGLNASVGQLEDMHLFNIAGEKIGEVEDVLGTEASTAVAVAIDLEDDRAAGDDDDVVVQLGDLSIQSGQLVTRLTAEQLAALPRYND